ncbi:MAG: hypothetical protein J3R72DRAFT_518798 [Linnemannia gamsii]|nr:MAG: hypothetical protein J3R72DRAFT_518798 [Linnemannia gamsii]
MEDTQSFRFIGTTDTVEITLNHVEGQNVVYWEDIEQVFPGVQRVRNGKSVIKFLQVSDQESSRSFLDGVISTTSVEPSLADTSKIDPEVDQTDRMDTTAGAAGEDRVTVAHIPETPISDIGLLNTSSSPSSAISAVSKARLFQQMATRATRKARESEVEQRFISLLAPEVQEKVQASPDIYQAFAKAIKDGHRGLSRAELRQELNGPFQKLEAMVGKNLELQEAMNAKQEEVRQLQEQVLNNQAEMMQLQQRALDQLAVLQSRVQAVLTQTYELHEYPIPRLFVVLPQDPSGWDNVNPFSNKFRLYFLCECGEHTKSINSKTNIPHHIHIAKHEGYEIARPTEFFEQYGSYVLTILKMLKFGLTAAGVALPALSHLISKESIDQATTALKLLQDTIVPGVDRVIDCIDNVSAYDSVVGGEVSESQDKAVGEVTEQMRSKEALEGADLRKLDTFLRGSDGNKVLGNLYRIVTTEGHVKWVCIDHYRENYNKTAAEEFRRAVDSVGGSFDENNGQVKVKLRSRVMAEQFYSALGKARSVYELDIYLDLEGSKSDLEALESALMKSRVSLLRLDLQNFRPSISSKVLSTSARYAALVRIVGHHNMKMIHIALPKDLVKLSDFPSKTPPHFHKLSFAMATRSIGVKDLRQLTESLETNSTLTTLNLYSNSIGENGAQALAEALKTNSTLTTLNLINNSIGQNGAQALAEVLKTNSTLTTLDLGGNSIGENGAQALAEALKTNSTLTTLRSDNQRTKR